MEADEFRVEPATWAVDRAAIEPVRLDVFVGEQQVPEDEEFDDDDPVSQHFVAIANVDGAVVGTGRLTPDGRIGRMAVTRDWRGRGVGRAILRSAIEAARLRHMEEVRLSAQVQAEGFYRRFGFEPEGEIFDDVGIPHRWMRLKLDADFVAPVARRRREPADTSSLPAGGFSLPSEYAERLLALIRCTRARLDVVTADLEPPLFNRTDVVEALKELLTLGAQPRVRVLVMDSTRAVQGGHRWIDLAQQRTSAMEIRNPPLQLADYPSAFSIADDRHILFRDLANRYEGRVLVDDPFEAKRLQEWFTEAWEHGTVDPQTRRLSL